MKKFKLKSDARKFFPRFNAEIKSLDWWAHNTVHENLLEEVPLVHVSYGIDTGKGSSNLRGYDHNKELGHIDFTVYFEGMTLAQYEKMNVPFWMDEIQKVIDINYKKLINGDL